MATQETYPWQQIEAQAFHAFREWPLWLVLRQRELSARGHQSPVGKAARAASVAAMDQEKET